MKNLARQFCRLKTEFSNWSTLALLFATMLPGVAVYVIFTGFYEKVGFSSLSLGICTIIWAGFLSYISTCFIGFLALLINRLLRVMKTPD